MGHLLKWGRETPVPGWVRTLEHDRQPEPGGELPGERLTRLSEASRRINESLDLPEVLQGVLDSAGR